jgi:bile acid-coenzyme A ligase
MPGRQSFGRVISARAQSNPDEVVVTSDHQGRRLTAAELDTASNQLARELQACGVRRDDLVTVALPNCIEFVVACAAIWKAGAVPNPLDPHIDAGDRRQLEKLARPTIVLGTSPQDTSIPWLPAGHVSRQEASALPDTWAASWKAPASSGSTGRPKIVLAAAPALIDPDRQVAPFLPRIATQLVTAPLWHSAQFTYAFRGLLTGHRLVLTDTFDEHWFCELVDRHRITWTMLSPSVIHLLTRLSPSAELASLESVLHLGAPCAPADKRALMDWLGPERVVEVYAGSESNGLTMITGSEWLRRPGSVGKPISGTEIRILGVDGAAAGTGETGHIWMRRGIEPSYRYLGGQSRRTPDGWDTLGDLGHLDADGYLSIAERAADVIDVHGTPVYPSRVEHALAQHPAVREAVVTGDAVSGVTAVVDIGDADVEASALIEFSRARLSVAEIPGHIDIRRSHLRNQAGKVRRSTFRSPSARAI